MNFSAKLAIFTFLLATLTITSCEETDNLAPAEDSFELAFQEGDNNGEIIPGKYIVVMKPDASGRRAAMTYEEAKADMLQTATSMLADFKVADDAIYQSYGGVIDGFAADLDEEVLAQLRNDSRVAYIEPDRIMRLAPPPGKGPNKGGDDGGGSDPTEVVPWGIARVGGAVTYTGSSVAWILDSGIDLDHPDLNVDASRGYNAFTSGRDGKSLDDGDGHGTHVAGTVAAIDNEIGVIGVAAGATVIPVKVLDSRGSGSLSGVIAGVNHVGANGSAGDVANMSLGGGAIQSLDDAVLAASQNGVKFFIAAGNSATDANSASPARVNGSNIYTISAMGQGDLWASYSNYGNPPIDYCAPGSGILSTWKDGGYNTISGTSMATPHAAGIFLVSNGSTDGFVIGDPDGNPDAIIVR